MNKSDVGSTVRRPSINKRNGDVTGPSIRTVLKYGYWIVYGVCCRLIFFCFEYIRSGCERSGYRQVGVCTTFTLLAVEGTSQRLILLLTEMQR